VNQTEQRQVATMMEFVEAFGDHDLKRWQALYATDAVYDDIGNAIVAHGRERLVEHAQDWLDAVPDFATEVVFCFAAGERAVIEWRCGGTVRGALPGVDATSPDTPGTFDIRVASVARFDNTGRIVYQSDYWNMAPILVASFGHTP
jgi:steroid delta-isomerase-like uncharacterized protein